MPGRRARLGTGNSTRQWLASPKSPGCSLDTTSDQGPRSRRRRLPRLRRPEQPNSAVLNRSRLTDAAARGESPHRDLGQMMSCRAPPGCACGHLHRGSHRTAWIRRYRDRPARDNSAQPQKRSLPGPGQQLRAQRADRRDRRCWFGGGIIRHKGRCHMIRASDFARRVS